MSKTILVTGANGQLGRELRITTRSCEDRYIFTDIDELDICDYDAIMRIAKDRNVDVIINCAAYTNVDKAEVDVGLSNMLNNKAVCNLSKVSYELNVTLIHISTDYIFDGVKYTPYTEDDRPNPLSIYGKTKLAGERCVIDSGCNYIIIRTSWLYSKWGDNFVKKMMELTSQRESIGVVFDQIGTPTYAGDLACAIVTIIEMDQLGECGLYHYSNEGICSWYDFAQAINEICGNECEIRPIHTAEFPSKVIRPHCSILDKTKFKNTFGVEIPYWRTSLKKNLL